MRHSQRFRLNLSASILQAPYPVSKNKGCHALFTLDHFDNIGAAVSSFCVRSLEVVQTRVR